MNCTCWSCAQRLQHGHCSSPGVKACKRRCTSGRGRRIHIILVWQTWRRMKGVWSVLGYQELPCSKVTDSACWHKWPIQTLHIPLQGKHHLTIVNVYTPTLTNPSEIKDTFCSETENHHPVAWQHPINWWCGEISVLGFAWSAQCGLVWLDIKGSATVTTIDYCSSICSEFKLCITNTVFGLPDKHMDASPFKNQASHQLCHHLTERHFWHSNHQGEAQSWVVNRSLNGVVAAFSINQTFMQAECC